MEGALASGKRLVSIHFSAGATKLLNRRLPYNHRRISAELYYVVDIAKLTDEEQTLVFGDILRTVYALYAEEGTEEYELPKKVIITGE